MLDAVVSLFSDVAANVLTDGQQYGKFGSGHPDLVPYQAFPAKDGYFIVACLTNAFWKRLCAAIGREDLLADPRFATMASRAEHGDEINGIVADWVKARTARGVQDVLERHEVPFGVAYSVADIFTDPHVAARGDIETVDDPVIGPVRMQGVYPRFSRTPGAIQRGAPRLGEHNAEVYGDLLGLGPEEMAQLGRDGVI
jgi:succinyl-CoA---D-citramalate CoA-transferase